MKYRSDIDGLRTIAVIPVILFHLGFEWIEGGYYGVDVFFVISGFLITSILFKNIENNSFSMTEFWMRRVKRILPAILTVILTTLTAAYILIYKGDLNNLSSDSIAAIFSYANIHAWFEFGNYWGTSAEKSFFLHAWSLSVEEQFYIFYPILLLVLFKTKQSYKKWLSAITLLSLIAYLTGSKLFPSSTFYLLPTRAWELSCGGLLATINLKKTLSNIKLSNYLSLTGFALIISSYFIFTGNDNINFHTLIPVIGSILIILFSQEDNIVGKLLSSSPLTYVGKISYSLYLWHWPIIVLLNNYYSHILSFETRTTIAIIATFIFSNLSYYFVESKTRKWNHTPKLVLGGITLIFILTTLLKKADKESYLTKTKFNDIEYYQYSYDISPKLTIIKDNESHKRIGVINPERPEIYKDAYKNGGIITSKHIKSNPKIVVLGDSHGVMWAKIIDEISESLDIKTSFYTASGIVPFFNIKNVDTQKTPQIGFTNTQRVDNVENFLQNLETWKPKALIIISKWNSRSNKHLAQLAELVELCNKTQTQVLIFNQPPQIDIIGNRNSAKFLSYLGYQPKKNIQYIRAESNVPDFNKNLKQYFKGTPNVNIFDCYSVFANNFDKTKTAIINKNDVLYYDDDHLNYQGTKFAEKHLKTALINLLNK